VPLFSKIKKKKKRSDDFDSPACTIAKGVPGVNDLIVSDGAVVAPDHIRIGERYARAYFAAQMPNEIFVTWLEEVYQMGDVDLSVHMQPAENHQVIRDLTHRITQYESQLYIERKKGDIYNLTLLEAKARDAWELRDAIQLNRDKMFFVSLQMLISADSLEELNRKGRYLEEKLSGRGVHVRHAFLRQMDAFRSVAPLGENRLSDIYRNFNLGASVAMFPFNNAELTHPGGTLLGVNRYTGAPVFFNAFIGPPALLNHNMAVFGAAGSGKSTFIKLYTARSALSGVRTVIIDPEGEYDGLAEQLGGVLIRFENDSPAMVNPFDLEPEVQENGTEHVRLVEKILEMKSLLNVMVAGAGGSLSPEDSALIEGVIRDEYRSLGISDDPQSLSERHTAADMIGEKRKEMPTLSSVYSRLEKLAPASALLVMLKPFLRGGTLGIFDGQSRVRLKDAPLVCFDVSRLEEKFMRPLAMHVVLGWTWEKFVKKNPHIKKHVVVDEAWRFMKYPDSADFLEDMSRRSRKRVAGLITATQGFYEFTGSQQGKSILTNSATMLLMQQSSADHGAIQSLLRLPEGQMREMRLFGQGDGLLRLGDAAAVIHVNVFPFEQDMVRTGISAFARKE
jgi:type IV secretory pathway VirB4 component